MNPDQSLKLSQWILELTKALVGGNGDTGGQIQTARTFANHWNGHCLTGVFHQEIRVQTLGFLPEHEPIPGLVLRLKIGSLCFGRKQPDTAGIFDVFPPVFESLVAVPGQMGPVIQPRSFQVRIVDFEPHFSHDVQLAVGADTSAPDISRILRNFGLNKNNAEKFLCIRQGVCKPLGPV